MAEKETNEKKTGPSPDKLVNTTNTEKGRIELNEEELGRVSGGLTFKITDLTKD